MERRGFLFFLYPKIWREANTHTAFFAEGGRKNFMCTWVKNGYRGGDIFR